MKAIAKTADIYFLLLYKSLYDKCEYKAKEAFESIPLFETDDEFCEYMFDFYANEEYSDILRLITPYEFDYDYSYENVFTCEMGVDCITIKHQSIYKVDYLYESLSRDPAKKEEFDIFFEKYKKAYEYLDKVLHCGECIDIIEGKNVNNEVDSVVLYIHQDPYYFKMFTLLYYLYLFVEELNSIVLYAEGVV